MAQVLAVVDGGACSGLLHVGDTITHVNTVSVVGKEPQDAQAVFEQSCTSLGKVVLHIDRPCNGMLHLVEQLLTSINPCHFQAIFLSLKFVSHFLLIG
jgi:hypothetical protein